MRDALARLDRAPVDAQIVKEADETYTIPGQPGRVFDGTAATAAALAVVRGLDAPPEVRVPAIATLIQPALTDVEVETAKLAADRMDAKLVIAFRDQDWKVKAATVRKWLGFSEGADGSVAPVVNMAGDHEVRSSPWPRA